MDEISEIIFGLIKSNYFELFITFIIATVITARLIPVIILYSKKLDFVDNPNERKVHKDPIPNLGGIAIFLGFFLSTLGWIMAYTGHNNFKIISIVYGLVVLFVMGIIDDRIDMKARTKFLIQIIVAVVIAAAGLRIESFNGLFFIWDLPIMIQYLFTILLVVGLTNAFNLIDGIDGLAGGLAFINAVVIGIVLYNPSEMLISLMSLGLAGSLLGFLFYNYNPAKIFMGDTGSLIIGYMMAVMGILLHNRSKLDPALMEIKSAETTILVVGVLMLPVYDTIRVFTKRILKGKSPFSPDKTHIHHLLIQSGLNHKRSANILYIANVVIIAIAYFYYKLFDNAFEPLQSLRDIMGIGVLKAGVTKSYISFWMTFAILSLFVVTALFSDFRRIYILLKMLFLRKRADKILEDNALLNDED